MSRLSGSKIKMDMMADKVHIHQITMTEAVARYKRTAASKRGEKRERMLLKAKEHGVEMMHGDSRLPRIVEEADKLIDEVLIVDPRLARKQSWHRGPIRQVTIQAGFE